MPDITPFQYWIKLRNESKGQKTFSSEQKKIISDLYQGHLWVINPFSSKRIEDIGKQSVISF